ncbi:uncharacterized protein K452DRAFT_284442 [Aplosporella prunicola CBS 121167]|uniref:Uncharacterized protein n=1 Tax=Aplosporella prunicola CBS 121167 TaxID=1176127 RepID=A0A6A6BNP7_9PEZI|nr:uncharacterized protein K452DRAFT_284442 [Aplosporella prunicola CBS 121167]KAF2145053.1 hypothetical protein K452DRAFT_284442 [Aplosporella prunicola CBS 121167]
MCFVLVGLCPHCGHMAALRTRYCDAVARQAWEPPNPCAAGVNEYEYVPGRACGRGCGGGRQEDKRVRRCGRWGRSDVVGVERKVEERMVAGVETEVGEVVEVEKDAEAEAEVIDEGDEVCASGMLLEKQWDGLDTGLAMVQDRGEAELKNEFAALMDWYRGEFAEQYVFEWELGEA